MVCTKSTTSPSNTTSTQPNTQQNKDVDLDAWGISMDVDLNKSQKPIKSHYKSQKPYKSSTSTSSASRNTQIQITCPSNRKSTKNAHNHSHRPPATTHSINNGSTSIYKPAIDRRFEWLSHYNSSHVLNKPEIDAILAHKSLNHAQRDIANQRINNLLLYINCPETRKWAGLCKYDMVDRIENVIQSLQSHKKNINNEMLDLFRIKSPGDERAQRRSLCVKAIKCMVPLLAYYHSLVKQIRLRNRKQNERNNKNKAFKPQSNANHRRNDNSNWWSFGKSADKWNKALNPEFSTLFRGHLLDENDYNQYVNVLHNDNDDEEYDAEDSGYDEWVNKVSLLGPSTSHPPGIDAVKTFRRKTNEHQSRLLSNLKLLYGNKNDMISRGGVYAGHLLSEYAILNRVGSGVYGCVFKAKTKRTNKIVAIKTLQLLLNKKQRQNIDIRQSKLPNKELVNAICPYMMIEGIPVPVIREIMSLKQLCHINITQLYDIVLNDPYDDSHSEPHQWNFHLVQEFVPNELYAVMKNLKSLHFERNKFNLQFKDQTVDNLDAKTLPQYPYWFSCANIKCIVFDLLQGLAYLESESYIHRDLKPSNILLTDDGIVKIADFGLSRAKYKENELLTNAHNVVTRYYRAPEILIEQNKRRSSYSFASDMWSIGAIFGELICGRPIFRAPNDMEQIFHIMHKCGSITESVWKGVSHIITEDPPADFCKTNRKTGQANVWYAGQAKFNFVANICDAARHKKRMLSSFLTPYIQHSWTQQNVAFGLDLINKMLCYDPATRIKPKEALKHKWFEVAPKRVEPKELIQKSKKSKKSSHTDLQKEQHQQQQQKMLKQQEQHRQQNLNNMNGPMQHNRTRGHMHGHSHNHSNNRRNVQSAHNNNNNTTKRAQFAENARLLFLASDNCSQKQNNKRPFNQTGNHKHGHNGHSGHSHHRKNQSHNNPNKKRRIN